RCSHEWRLGRRKAGSRQHLGVANEKAISETGDGVRDGRGVPGESGLTRESLAVAVGNDGEPAALLGGEFKLGDADPHELRVAVSPHPTLGFTPSLVACDPLDEVLRG